MNYVDVRADELKPGDVMRHYRGAHPCPVGKLAQYPIERVKTIGPGNKVTGPELLVYFEDRTSPFRMCGSQVVGVERP